MRIILNGQPSQLDQLSAPASLQDLVAWKQLPAQRIAIAVNGEVVPRSRWDRTTLKEGDSVDIVHAVGGGREGAAAGSPDPSGQHPNAGAPATNAADAEDDPLVIAGVTFRSRLFLGTGKFSDPAVMVESLERAQTEMVTMAIRQLNLENPDEDAILPYLDPSRYRWLPNTAGATTAEQAVTLARLAREATGTHWIKLEVIGDPETLWPDTAATIEATRILVSEGFVVLPYTSPDLVAALRLEDAGAATVMPLASPIGSGQGFNDWTSIQRIIDRVKVPVVVDAGIGSPSDAALAMEMGCAAVLVNTAVAKAGNPPLMAQAMAEAVRAGRRCFLAGRIPKGTASASSPVKGVPV